MIIDHYRFLLISAPPQKKIKRPSLASAVECDAVPGDARDDLIGSREVRAGPLQGAAAGTDGGVFEGRMQTMYKSYKYTYVCIIIYTLL